MQCTNEMQELFTAGNTSDKMQSVVRQLFVQTVSELSLSLTSEVSHTIPVSIKWLRMLFLLKRYSMKIRI